MSIKKTMTTETAKKVGKAIVKGAKDKMIREGVLKSGAKQIGVTFLIGAAVRLGNEIRKYYTKMSNDSNEVLVRDIRRVGSFIQEIEFNDKNIGD